LNRRITTTMSEPKSNGYDQIQIGGGDTAQPINLRSRLRLLESRISFYGKKVIDCGCGAGGYVMEFLRMGADAYGIEYSEEKVARFKESGRDLDRVRVGDLQRMDFPDDTFDFALLNEVLEHVPDERKGLAEVWRILRRNGTLVIFSPNRLYPFETHGITPKWNRKPVAPHRTLLVPYIPLPLGKHLFDYHARNYFPGQLRRLVAGAGFRIVHRTYIWQSFENISGSQADWIRALRPGLRKVSSVLQRTPLLRSFGVSQVIFAVKPERS